ncbi:hypothetical protein L1887_51127 [Cichorium endivia]|nr:hypothetical protein L1887_51127 [Cichorium endivia]
MIEERAQELAEQMLKRFATSIRVPEHLIEEANEIKEIALALMSGDPDRIIHSGYLDKEDFYDSEGNRLEDFDETFDQWFGESFTFHGQEAIAGDDILRAVRMGILTDFDNVTENHNEMKQRPEPEPKVKKTRTFKPEDKPKTKKPIEGFFNDH